MDGEAYYCSDVQVKYIFTDNISGLGKTFLKAGVELTEETNYLEQAGTDRIRVTRTAGYISPVSGKEPLAAEHNNQNDVPVLATVIDNAGYEDQVEKKIHIDTTDTGNYGGI